MCDVRVMPLIQQKKRVMPLNDLFEWFTLGVGNHNIPLILTA